MTDFLNYEVSCQGGSNMSSRNFMPLFYFTTSAPGPAFTKIAVPMRSLAPLAITKGWGCKMQCEKAIGRREKQSSRFTTIVRHDNLQGFRHLLGKTNIQQIKHSAKRQHNHDGDQTQIVI